MMCRLWVGCLVVFTLGQCASGENRKVLVFGGNGLLGASTVEKLLDQGEDVTIVNRGNWYWDSKTRILPRVNHIRCDRQASAPCQELVELVKDTTEFDAVYDFSSYGPEETKAAIDLLQGKVGLYIYISTDSIYDVCTQGSKKEPVMETEDKRPEDPQLRDSLSDHHLYGHRKLQAEEEIRKQREGEDGFPYVILRLPDVIGPRDTTHRLWVYTLWVKMAPYFRQHPVQVPYFLKDYGLSFVYVEDVAKLAVELMDRDYEVLDEAYNLAYPEPITLEELLRTLEEVLEPERHQGFNIDEKGTSMYYYPSVRSGPINVKKAISKLNWQTTPLRQALRDSTLFYERAMRDEDFPIQRNEIVQIVQKAIFVNESTEFYKKLQELYGIDLKHFINTKEEL